MPQLHLALQGGGSHGAFTWGVLDALLEADTLEIGDITGTSAGALNAVALASGWSVASQRGASPRAGARDTLRGVWDEVVLLDAVGAAQRQWLRAFFGAVHPFAALPGVPVPPLPFHPLRQLLAKWIDFDALRQPQAPSVHVSATAVRSGRAAIFSGATLTLDAVLASACLPALFPPVMIDGEPYWDGGFSVNPPLAPFLHGGGPRDVVLVQINPVKREAPPASPAEVSERVNELTFNAGLLSQVRAVEHVNQLVDVGLLPPDRRIFLHRIDGGDSLQAFPQATRVHADAGLIRELFALGREAAAGWLDRHAGELGRCSTIPFEEYADATWLRLAPTPASAPRRLTPAQLGRWLRRSAAWRWRRGGS